VVKTAENQLPVLARLPLDTGKLQGLTKPPADSEGDSTPAVSPTGSTIAFVRHQSDDRADIFVCDGDGGSVHAVTFDSHSIRGIAWSRDGQELIYSSNRANGWRLWRVSAFGGSPREVAVASRRAYFPSAGRNRLVYADSPAVSAIWRASLGDADSVDERTLIRSTGQELKPVFSPDGTKVANVSDQTGNDEIFIADAGGENRFQLTNLKGPDIGRVRWSPDGKLILFDASAENRPEVFTIPATAGAKPTRVAASANNASFSSDGKRIYYQSRSQIWKVTAAGANPELVTEESGVGQPAESADGKYVFYRSHRGIWRVPTSGGEAEEAFMPDHDMWGSTTLQPTAKGVYFTEFERSSNSMVVSFHEFASKKNSVVFHLPNTDWGGGGSYSISPDGKSILYSRVDQSQTNLMLVEGFR
jgi:Tol biopolymer transport system component